LKHTLLWLDMTVSVHDAGASDAFERSFELHRLAPLSSIQADVSRLKPAVAVFDFDFPTKQGLDILRETKRTCPSLPLIMLTVQHSEALAVWAFRSRVWDYLVKPLSKPEVDRCLGSLNEMFSIRDGASRTAAIPGATIPEEHRTTAARGHHSLTPALTYVEQNFREKIASGKAAALCNLSPFQFSRSFKEAYGITFQEYLLRFRIREACRLLKNPGAVVIDIAHLVGFNDSSYFCKIFKRYTSMSPSRFSTVGQGSSDIETMLYAAEHVDA
jgi:YesN/AraC family two-component response regulator